MRSTGAAVKVGLTALGIALLAFFSFKFVAKGIGGPSGYNVWALFHDATGLVDKSRVQIAGQQTAAARGTMYPRSGFARQYA